MAVVPQEVLLFGGSIRENIEYGQPGASPEEIEAAAKKANAHDFISKFPEGYETLVGPRGVKLSGGQRQRIAIAMALMSEPDLLIADEPTTALDATLEVQIIERLKDLQRDLGCAVLFISHHLGVIAELCDRVVVMYAGAVVESGTVREIFHNPKHPYTRRLIECDPGHI